MDSLRRLSSNHDRLFLALVVLALAVRALVPSGWMVMAGADGAARLTICTGTGPIVEMPSPAMATMPGMAHHDDGAPTHPDHPCAFVGLGLASALPTLDLPAPVRLRNEQDLPGRPVAVAIGHGLAAPPPPQTGPPAFA